MDDKRLDLNLLLALEALLAELNVTRAAKRLNLSQPALSAQLSRLRAIFGDPLLIPTSRGMLPTAMASDLGVPLRLALDQARALVNRAQTFDPANANMTFSIAASDYMQVAILLPFLLQLSCRAPGLRVMVRLGDVRLVGAELERGDADVALVESEDVGGRDLRRLDVLSERYIGIARRHTVERGFMPIDRFMAASHIIVSPRAQGFTGPTDEALAAVGLTRQVAFAVSSFVFLIEAVSRSDLLALAPQRLVERYADRVDIFKPPIAVPGFKIAMVWHDRTHAHPARAWLRDQIAEFCAAHQTIAPDSARTAPRKEEAIHGAE
ncbi:LysR family transcriptional regulator [Paraburkholderia sp. BL25I1N1]|uniref:LysR family transcriptional regulator n=1 Tax=Paraburkholderia sp. BL25I1N1 TaxID=1938804 RepID=UPI000D04D1AA|nr:LysR family transcriptional regulator [Paraburkholderia sp. BL25I1N1]PRY04457.1 LysR family transcriptional regulator [Paraburkholderia sp. BL25I1N1]